MNKNLSQLFAYKEGLDTRSTQFLMKALESNNLPGFDYIEFKQSLGALISMNIDEATAFKSAFATASTMGLTKQKLLESASHYQKILLKEKGQFDIALKNRIEQRVGKKEEENKQHTSRIQQIQTQIKRLEQEIVELRQKIEHNNQTKGNDGEKLIAQQKNFELTYNSIQKEIDNDVHKISQFL